MRYLCLIVAFGFAATTALAQSGITSSDEIKRVLKPGSQPMTGKTRSLAPAKTRTLTVEDDGKVVEKPIVAAIDLYVPFDYDSDEISDGARKVLEQLAIALKDGSLTDFRFVVAGHTDARGSDTYNNDLSRRRAQSVLAHLVVSHGIDPSRLIATGLGKTSLKDPNNDEINRRVEILNVGK
jgi:outer membrane protein OmpA-like peptidoglycan-associated protein